MSKQRVERREQLKRDLLESIDDLVVTMLTQPSGTLASFTLRQKRIEPIIEAIEELINF